MKGLRRGKRTIKKSGPHKLGALSRVSQVKKKKKKMFFYLVLVYPPSWAQN